MGWFKCASDNVELQSRDRCRLPVEDSGPEEGRHNAFCNFCSKTIYGTRFKCVECSNLDSCLECLENMAVNHDEQHRLLPIVDPGTDVLPDHVLLFQGLQDAKIAKNHPDGYRGPGRVICAKYDGEEWAQGISVVWLPRETPRLADHSGVMLHDVPAVSYGTEASSQSFEHTLSPSQDPWKLHGPTPIPEPPVLQNGPTEDRPISFYEAVVSKFPATSQCTETPVAKRPFVYRYESLNAQRTIRVLQLWPGSGDTQIRCNTQVIPLGENRQYYALSYTWGDQSTGALITLDGMLFPIAQNLCDALLQLRLPQEIRTLWIDAMCINQLDDYEKSVQVALMRDIYQQAALVVVWLGPAENDSDIAMDYLSGDVTAGSGEADVPAPFEYDPESECISDWCGPRIRALMEQGNDYEAGKGQSRLQLRDTDQNQRKMLTPTGGVDENIKIARALLAFLRRPWWTRVWVIQECAVPNKSPLVLCGQRTTDWDSLWVELDLPNMVRVLIQYDSHNFPSTDVEACSRFPTLYLIRRMFQEDHTTEHELIDLLEYNRVNCSATDPRDKVYGLLGLTSERCRTALLPDYSKSVAGVYGDTAKFIMSSTGSLDILGTGLISHHIDDSNFPSWVPDWSLSFSERPRRNLNTWGAQYKYDASHGYRADIRSNPDPAILELKGLLVDIIGYVCPVITRDHVTDPRIRKTIHVLRQYVMLAILNFFENAHSESDSLIARIALTMHPHPRKSDRFWRTLVEDRWKHEDQIIIPAPDHVAELFEIFLDTTDEDEPLIRSNRLDQLLPDDRLNCPRLKTPQASTIPESFMPESDEAIRRESYLQPLIARIRDVLEERSLFITKCGCMGLGPPGCKPGDAIAVLLGGQLPFVLRQENREDGAVRIIGESYVHGVMLGEILAPDLGLESRLETFKLC